jgi:hypothetical protein
LQRVDPDGIAINYVPESGGLGMASLKFRNLPIDIQQACGFDPQSEEAYTIHQLAQEEAEYAVAAKNAVEQKANQSDRIATLFNIVQNYHATHLYLTNSAGTSIYVCGDMACDVWNMVQRKGITAQIVIGNIKEDITHIGEANHAWVLAQIADGDWIALETTAGQLVRQAQNPRYFFGCRFATSKDFRDFQYLENEYGDAFAKYRSIHDNYTNLVAKYNSPENEDRVALKSQIQETEAVLRDRIGDVRQLESNLESYHLTSN